MSTRCTRARERGRQAISNHASRRSRILNDMHNPSDIFKTRTWVCMGLGASTCSECLPVATCQFSRLKQSTCHGPLRGPTLAPWCSGGLPACPEPRARDKTRGRERKKCMCKKKTHLYMETYPSQVQQDTRYIGGILMHVASEGCFPGAWRQGS